MPFDFTDCCAVWREIRPNLRWFSGEFEEGSLLIMPCMNGTNYRVNFCPSCGAPRRNVAVKREETEG